MEIVQGRILFKEGNYSRKEITQERKFLKKVNHYSKWATHLPWSSCLSVCLWQHFHYDGWFVLIKKIIRLLVYGCRLCPSILYLINIHGSLVRLEKAIYVYDFIILYMIELTIVHEKIAIEFNTTVTYT